MFKIGKWLVVESDDSRKRALDSFMKDHQMSRTMPSRRRSKSPSRQIPRCRDPCTRYSKRALRSQTEVAFYVVPKAAGAPSAVFASETSLRGKWETGETNKVSKSHFLSLPHIVFGSSALHSRSIWCGVSRASGTSAMRFSTVAQLEVCRHRVFPHPSCKGRVFYAVAAFPEKIMTAEPAGGMGGAAPLGKSQRVSGLVPSSSQRLGAPSVYKRGV
ncbi:UNVERIFIED_CONTAM: hypothetical protein HHA_452680 [Hammondia hammondi]|eukprot:XP_008885869.1 hypothetical protein HHA_452680 [Hammondia hammondi]